MNAYKKSADNKFYGSILLTLGLIAWVGAVYFSVVPKKELPPPIQASQVDLASCKSALSELGFSVIERGDDLSISEALSAFPKEQLEKASLAASICKTEMRSFCMGEGCERQGLVMTIKKPEAPKPIETPKSDKPKEIATNPANPLKAPPKGLPNLDSLSGTP